MGTPNMGFLIDASVPIRKTTPPGRGTGGR
jgi:hypothetical protein